VQLDYINNDTEGKDVMTVNELIDILNKYKHKDNEVYLYNEEYGKMLKLQTYMIDDMIDDRLDITFDFSED